MCIRDRYGDVPLYRVWVLTSLSETGYLIISVESMYFRVRILNLQRLTYTKEYVKRILNDELVDKKNKQYLLHEDPKPGRFYILPKSHKVNNPSRPIVSSNNQPTECISQFVDFHRQTLGLHYTVIRQRYH